MITISQEDPVVRIDSKTFIIDLKNNGRQRKGYSKEIKLFKLISISCLLNRLYWTWSRCRWIPTGNWAARAETLHVNFTFERQEIHISLVVKGLSWAHSIVQKFLRFQLNDGKDRKTMLEYLESTKDSKWHSNPRTVLQWLSKKLPAEVCMRKFERKWCGLLH
jgi:hypothetical protein